MKKNLFFFLLLMAAIGFSLPLQAADPTLVISTGKEGGGYNTIGKRLQSVMAEQDISVKILTSVGSLENLKHLDDPASPVNLGLSQADALKYYLHEHPDFANKMMTLGEIGKECVFIVTGKDSGIRSDGDLQVNRGNLMAIRDPDSGTAVTYSYMIQLEPKFKNTPAAFVDTMEALLQIKTGGEQNKIKAAMFVQRPTAKSAEMQAVLNDPKDFRFIPVTDWDLNDKLPDGSAVYTFEKVTVAEKKWGFDTTVDTICTRGLLLAARDKLSADLRERLAKVMLLASSRVVGETP
jgi:TRAP-type uncharacterized transport system substrate-binding protein